MKGQKSFVFSREATDKLKDLTRRCKLSSDSATVRLSLSLLDELLDVVERKGTITIRDRAGKEHLFHPLLEAAE